MQYIRECFHVNSIDDYSNGCKVCLDCGLVLQEQLFTHRNPNTCLSVIKYNDDSMFSKNNIKYFLIECLERAHFQNVTYIVDHLFTSICKLKHIDQVHAFAIKCYEYCKLNNIARTKNEICEIFQITPKQYNNAESRLYKKKSQIDVLKPSVLLPRISNLQLSHSDKLELGAIADNLSKRLNASPGSIMAYVLYTYSHTKTFNWLHKKKLTLAACAVLCKVSPTSIRRLIKKMEH